jgi:hypothetical protein
MAVTQDQVDRLQTDFNALLDDVMGILPPSSQKDFAVMMFKMAEASVVVYAKQHLVKAP